jgi:hypothetical protein
LEMSNWLPQIRAERPISYRDLIPFAVSLLQLHGTTWSWRLQANNSHWTESISSQGRTYDLPAQSHPSTMLRFMGGRSAEHADRILFSLVSFQAQGLSLAECLMNVWNLAGRKSLAMSFWWRKIIVDGRLSRSTAHNDVASVMARGAL